MAMHVAAGAFAPGASRKDESARLSSTLVEPWFWLAGVFQPLRATRASFSAQMWIFDRSTLWRELLPLPHREILMSSPGTLTIYPDACDEQQADCDAPDAEHDDQDSSDHVFPFRGRLRSVSCSARVGRDTLRSRPTFYRANGHTCIAKNDSSIPFGNQRVEADRTAEIPGRPHSIFPAFMKTPQIST
jgi:hypothetical protein